MIAILLKLLPLFSAETVKKLCEIVLLWMERRAKADAVKKEKINALRKEINTGDDHDWPDILGRIKRL